MTNKKPKKPTRAEIRRLEQRVIALAGEAAATISKEKADVRKAGGAFVCKPMCRLCRIASAALELRAAKARAAK